MRFRLMLSCPETPKTVVAIHIRRTPTSFLHILAIINFAHLFFSRNSKINNSIFRSCQQKKNGRTIFTFVRRIQPYTVRHHPAIFVPCGVVFFTKLAIFISKPVYIIHIYIYKYIYIYMYRPHIPHIHI